MSIGGIPPLPSRLLQGLVCGLLAVSLTGLDLSVPLSWPTGLLVLMAGLKLREARRISERRLVALLQLLAVGLLAAQQTGLLASTLELLLILSAMAGLLQLELGMGLRWRQALRHSLQLLAAALPVALVLFLLVPRLAPIWTLPRGMGSSAQTGLNEQIDPGSVATLADSDALAARVAFSSNSPPSEEQRYWRVLVHERFDGDRWQRETGTALLPWTGRRGTALPSGGIRQLWLVPSNGLDAVPWDGHAEPIGTGLELSRDGELRWRGGDGRSYALESRSGTAPWQLSAPTQQDLELPQNAQPRLQALGRSWASLPEPAERLDAAAAWFRSQPFRYSRSPGTLPQQQGLDVFLFDRQVGFCGHYASAFAALMRAAGIPARVVSGYRGGVWVQPMGSTPYLEIRAHDAHAWSEIWLAGRGWVAVDPSRWAEGDQRGTAATSQGPENWWRWGQRQWGGLDVAWSRWWLGFDRAQQEAVLHQLLGSNRDWLGLWVLLAVGASQGLALLALWLLKRCRNTRHSNIPPEARAMKRFLAALEKRGLTPTPGEALESFCERAGKLHPELKASIQEFCRSQQALLYGPMSQSNEQTRAEQQRLWRSVAEIRRVEVRN